MLRFTASPSISSRDHALLHSPYLPLGRLYRWTSPQKIAICPRVERIKRHRQRVTVSSRMCITHRNAKIAVSRRITQWISPVQRAHSDDVPIWLAGLLLPRASPQVPSSRDFSGGDFSLNYAYQWRVHAAAVIADGQVFIKPRSARRIYTPRGITNTTVWPSNDSHCASKRTHMGHDDMATDRKTRARRTERGR